jgi:hypothetical protein
MASDAASPRAARANGPSDGSASSEALEDRVAAEKARALKEPGPSWRTWFLQNALRWYYFLGILILDVQVIVFWIEVNWLVGIVPSLVVLLYLELLLYRYLWYRPRSDAIPRRAFRRTWLRPAEYGRWTPEADLVRAGVSIYRTEEGPSPKEFL